MTDICTFCQMEIAPADPFRVVYQGRAAHRYCIIRNQNEFQRLCAHVNSLMALCRLPEQDDEWRQQYQAGHVTNLDCLIHTLRCCFRRIDRWRERYGIEGPYVWPTATMVAEIRQELSERLFCEL